MAAEFFQERISDARREWDAVRQIRPPGLRSLRTSISAPNIGTPNSTPTTKAAAATASAPGSQPPGRQEHTSTVEDAALERPQGLYSGGQERPKNEELRRSLADLRAGRAEAGSSASASFGAHDPVSRSVPSMRKPAVLESPPAAPRRLRPSGHHSQMVPTQPLPSITDGSQSEPAMRPPSQGRIPRNSEPPSPQLQAGISPPGFRPGRRLRSRTQDSAAVSPSPLAVFARLGHNQPTGAPRVSVGTASPQPGPEFINLSSSPTKTVHVLQPGSSSPGVLRTSPGIAPSPDRVRRHTWAGGEAPLNAAPGPSPGRLRRPSLEAMAAVASHRGFAAFGGGIC